MASMIPGAPPAPPAAGTPGTPAEGQVNAGAGAGGAGNLPQPAGGDQTGGGDATQMVQETITMVRMIDKALRSLTELYADTGGQEVSQATELLQQATAKWVAKFGGAGAPALSGTDTGPGFPGGGFNNSSVMPGA